MILSTAADTAPLLSVITVVRNGRDELARTLASLEGRWDHRCELVVVDGASTDGTLDLIRNSSRVSSWSSEPDEGIYDAMNKGISRSTGRYLFFLNAGDELAIDLAELMPYLTAEPVIVYGLANMIRSDGAVSYRKGRRLESHLPLLWGMRLCHQAILYRRDALPGYDLRYRIIADRVATFRILRKYGAGSTLFLDRPLVNYYEGGVSGKQYLQLRREEIVFLRNEGYRLLALYKYLALLLKKKRFARGKGMM